jgi:hypothetical protein
MPMLDNLTVAQSSWFIALLILWAGLLFGGFIFGKPDAKRERRMPAWTRMTSSVALVIAGWIWNFEFRIADLETTSLGSEIQIPKSQIPNPKGTCAWHA